MLLGIRTSVRDNRSPEPDDVDWYGVDLDVILIVVVNGVRHFGLLDSTVQVRLPDALEAPTEISL